jgi:predicted HTH transcriptional regulator
MWSPKTTKELEEAITNGTLPREPTAFEVKAQLPGASKNSDIAADVAAMAVEGGYIIYGVAEDKAAGTFTANPIPLKGEKERIGQVVASYAQEHIEFEVHELPLDADPTMGYLVVEVPASARAPHMVESKGRYQYYGRQPGGNRILGEAEVARLYERRQRIEDEALKALDEAMAHTSVPPAEGRADLHVVVVPLVSNADVRQKAMAGQGQPRWCRT